MVAQLLFDCCKQGHPWTPPTTMICNGRRRCRICHNRRTNDGIKKRYRTDNEFRKKVCARSNARHARRRKELQNEPPHCTPRV